MAPRTIACFSLDEYTANPVFLDTNDIDETNSSSARAGPDADHVLPPSRLRSVPERTRAVVDRFEREGLDLAATFLNPGARDEYDFGVTG